MDLNRPFSPPSCYRTPVSPHFHHRSDDWCDVWVANFCASDHRTAIEQSQSPRRVRPHSRDLRSAPSDRGLVQGHRRPRSYDYGREGTALWLGFEGMQLLPMRPTKKVGGTRFKAQLKIWHQLLFVRIFSGRLETMTCQVMPAT